jgi:CelD/BcsL family acetyltransferase involved in cellulose biosynthesis
MARSDHGPLTEAGRDIQVLKPAELTPGMVDRWIAIQRACPAFHSPFFRPEYVQAAGAVRDDVQIAVLLQAARPVGFFPFERSRWNIARPVGGRLSDFQGGVVEPDARWTPTELLLACRLKGWGFDHQISSQTQWQPHWAREDVSPYLDLSEGFEAYLRRRRDEGSDRVNQFVRKLRKIGREIGPVRFVTGSNDLSLLDQLVAWKAVQYRERQLANLFRFPKVTALIKQLLTCRTPEFQGCLSALYAGDQLAAVLFSMRSHEVWHYHLPAYNPELGKYSPGSLLLTKLAQEAAAIGIARIDLGSGAGDYKASFATTSDAVYEGSIDRLRVVGGLRAVWRGTRDVVKGSGFARQARRPIRWMRGTLDWMAYS